ncbi:MAG: hypothetical protein CBC05_03305 [Crocinitomicaceae bacterium TMED45]|nr:MAG: hypothetical protein CBC05_03305 [Crocinitomicaceae bacterium TMED45]|tara:strand:+ start:237 stop:686 length:450 start_codon:yes stop_codon:yes gene_type:complete
MTIKEIYLNIYDLHKSNNYFCHIGCGFYHTTLLIGNKEFDYGPSLGIEVKDLDYCDLNLRDSIYLLSIDKSYTDLNNIVTFLDQKYNRNTYNPICHNCHNFTEDLYYEITNRKIINDIPIYLKRFRYFFSCFSCLFPKNNHILKYFIRL